MNISFFFNYSPSTFQLFKITITALFNFKWWVKDLRSHVRGIFWKTAVFDSVHWIIYEYWDQKHNALGKVIWWTLLLMEDNLAHELDPESQNLFKPKTMLHYRMKETKIAFVRLLEEWIGVALIIHSTFGFHKQRESKDAPVGLIMSI